MYDVALTVEACLRAGTRVDLAWVVQTRGFSSRERGEALAITPGGGRVGSVLAGALNDQLADQASRRSDPRIVDLTVGDLDAMVAGLSCGGEARCLLMSATELPAELWEQLRDREPVCLVTHLDGDAVTGTSCSPARPSTRPARRSPGCSAAARATPRSRPTPSSRSCGRCRAC